MTAGNTPSSVTYVLPAGMALPNSGQQKTRQLIELTG